MLVRHNIARQVDPGSTGELRPAVIRRVLHASAIADVANLDVRETADPIRGFASAPQVALPYRGMFGWDVGQGEVYLDSNCAALLADGLEYTERQAYPAYGHSAILVSPHPALWDELSSEARRRDVRPLTDVPLRLSARLRLLTHQWILRLEVTLDEPLPQDELVIETCRETMSLRAPPRAVPQRLVRRTKEILQEHARDHMSLVEMAEIVGVTPVYLTQMFSRAEGVSLYRYQLNLRLGQAMLELPHTEDITKLALGLGFSSHSHFSTAFKAFSGMTPSRFRARFDRALLAEAKQQLLVS